MSQFQTLIHESDVPENGSVAVEMEGMALLVCKSAGDLWVVENRCSHQDQPLEGGRIRNGYIFCPVHGMRYKLANGEAVGQLTSAPIKAFDIRVEDGFVQVARTE